MLAVHEAPVETDPTADPARTPSLLKQLFPAPLWRNKGWLAAFLLVGGVTAVLGYLQLMTTFAAYDDEGYMMVTIGEFLARGALYDQVYSQYGPFFAQFWAAVIGGLGFVDLTHNYARGLVLAGWLSTSVLIGASVWRLTRSGLLGVAVQLLVFVALGSLVNEPLHPGGLISLLLAAMVAVVAFILPARPRLAAALLGALIAALAMVKVNIGGLALVAALLAAALTLPGPANRRAIRLGAAALAVLAPVVLVSSDLGEPWTQRYAIVVVGAIAAVAVTAWPDAPIAGTVAKQRGSCVATAVGAMVVTALLICLVAVATGTSVRGLIDGVLLAPLQQSDAFRIPLDLSPASFDFALLGLGLAVVLRRAPLLQRQGRATVALAAGVIILWSIADPTLSGFLSAGDVGFAVALPLAWVATLMIPSAEVDPPRRFAIVFVTGLAVLQTLHAYPVAGSQVNWATFLLVPVGALSIGMAWPVAGRVATAAQVAVAFVVVLIAKVSFGGVIEPLNVARATYRANVPFALRGADRLRVEPSTVETFRGLTDGIKAHCSAFLTLPGMNSLYLLSGQRPPTGMNATAWMYLFDEPTQQRVVDQVANQDRLCVVRNDELLTVWSQGRPIPERPLYRFITKDVEPIDSYGSFVLQIKR